MEAFLMILMFLVAVFLILLVLVQRGRGGGLAGALGGMGGQSAFGTKAGDLFTKITIGAAFVWIVLCMFTVKWMATSADPFSGFQGRPNTPATAPGMTPGSTTPEGSTPEAPAQPGTSKPAESADSGTAAGDKPAAESEGTTPEKKE